MSYKEAIRQMSEGIDRETALRQARHEAERDEWVRRAREYQAAQVAAEAASTRVARCSCGAEAPSTEFLAFRETAESHAADRCETCGYAECAHADDVRSKPHMRRAMSDGHVFVQAQPRDFDTFYCGHSGWD